MSLENFGCEGDLKNRSGCLGVYGVDFPGTDIFSLTYPKDG
jgi:hypothetical protein